MILMEHSSGGNFVAAPFWSSCQKWMPEVLEEAAKVGFLPLSNEGGLRFSFFLLILGTGGIVILRK